MSQARLLRLLIAAIGLLGLDLSAAWGATVSVNPVRIELSESKRSELVELRNAGADAARFQLQAHAWHEGSDGEMTLKPTRDMLFFPSLLEIPPGETKRVRVATTARPGRVERSYRLIVEEFPRKPTPGTILVLTRLSIPVFVQPAKPKPRPALDSRLEDGRLVVLVTNTGNAAFKLESVRVVARSTSGEVVFEQTISGWYVLAKGRRRYAIELPKATCSEIAAIDASARTDAGNASSVSSVRPGADCGG